MVSLNHIQLVSQISSINRILTLWNWRCHCWPYSCPQLLSKVLLSILQTKGACFNPNRVIFILGRVLQFKWFLSIKSLYNHSQMFIQKKTQSSLSKVSKVTPETPSLFSNQTLSLGQFEIPYSAISDHEVKNVNVIIPNKQTNQNFKTSTQCFFRSPSTPFPLPGLHVRPLPWDSPHMRPLLPQPLSLRPWPRAIKVGWKSPIFIKGKTYMDVSKNSGTFPSKSSHQKIGFFPLCSPSISGETHLFLGNTHIMKYNAPILSVYQWTKARMIM